MRLRNFKFYCVFRNLGSNNIPTARQTLNHCMSTSTGMEKLAWGGCSREILLEKFRSAMKDHKVNEAWDIYKDVKRIYGFPDKVLIGKLMTEMSYSNYSYWIKKASSLVLSISEEKPELLQPEVLTKLTLTLARAEMPVLTSIVLRLMLSKKILPPVNMLQLIFHHMVNSETGTVLASNILIEICDCFQELNANRSGSVKLGRPDATIFNLVLDGCVKFRSSMKGQQIIELMAEVGVVADAYTVVMMTYIHEMNGMRDELKRLKSHVDLASMTLLSHYQHFYDRLLSLHFKFNDIDAVTALVLDLYNRPVGKQMHGSKSQLQKPCSIIIGYHNLREGLKLNMLPHDLPRDSVFKLEGKMELMVLKNGQLVLTNKALAKLVVLFDNNGRKSELSRFLVQMHKRSNQSEYNSVCMDAIDACINLGWLETAHDILDDSKLEGKSLAPAVYKALLTAYCDRGMFREAETLLKQMKESDVPETRNLEKDFAQCYPLYKNESITNLKELPSRTVSSLTEAVVRELREDAKILPVANELNSSIYFFMKAKMTVDALKTYRRMQELKIRPTDVTFFYMIVGYSSLEMYREITIVWGDIKKNYIENRNLKIHRDLCEFILFNFLRGGYFGRVMEMMSFMKENNMYLDKWMYKREYQKCHKDLYRKLKASDAKNESQRQRIEHVQAFREWVGLG